MGKHLFRLFTITCSRFKVIYMQSLRIQPFYAHVKGCRLCYLIVSPNVFAFVQSLFLLDR